MAQYTIPWNTVNTLVGDFVVKSLREQIYKSNAFLMRLRAKQKPFTGGRTIQHPLVWKKEGDGGGWFSGAEMLDTTIRDTLTMAVGTPKNFYIPIVFTWDDQLTVMGPTQLKSLISTKMEQAKATAYDTLAGDLFNDGSSAKRVTGLQYILKAGTGTAPGVLPAQTYLGISRQGRYDGTGGGTQTNNYWCHQVDNTAYSDAAGGNFDPLTPGAIDTVLGANWARVGLAAGWNKTPTLLLSNWGSYTAYMNSFSAKTTYQRPQQDTKLAEAGYENVKYKRASWLVDEKSPRSSSKVESIFGINEETLRLFVHGDADFAFEPFRKPHNQMAQVAYILWRGELMCIEPRANFHISAVTTSTSS